MSPNRDEMIKQEINEQLTWDNRVDASNVQITVSDGIVTLDGVVPHHLARIASFQDAYQIAGIRNVINNLEVRFPSGSDIPNDEELAESIRNMLHWNHNLDDSNIRVESLNGVVTLFGTVDSYWAKYTAEDIAGSAKGVVDVKNNLEVSLVETVIDRDIERDINKAFERSMLIDEEKIGVEVDGGEVHLMGVVSSYPIRKEAHNIALYTAGVTDVKDEITIG